jgi:DNA-binding MarR family transcriptional regulator
LLTYLQYPRFDDTSIKIPYYGVVARPRRLDEEQRLLWKAYRDLFHGLSGALQEQLLRDAGLSGSEYAVLVELAHAPDGVLRARELGSELGWDRSRLSHLVRRMETRGLVVREECAEDGRGSMVRLTDAGRAAVQEAAPEHSEAVRRYFFNPLSSDELETLGAVLDRLLDNLEREKAATDR